MPHEAGKKGGEGKVLGGEGGKESAMRASCSVLPRVFQGVAVD